VSVRGRRRIVRAQAALRDCLTSLAERREYECRMPRGVRLFVPPPPRRKAGPRRPAFIQSIFFGRDESARLIQAAVEMLNALGADRLKRCPFAGSTHEPPCGKLFLAKRGSKTVCERRHAARTSYLKWWRKKGGTRAKR
jgi:hypothetical protein